MTDEKIAASQMLRVPTPLIQSVKELSRLHREGYTELIIETMQSLIAKIDNGLIQADSTDDSSENQGLEIVLARLEAIEGKLERLEPEPQKKHVPTVNKEVKLALQKLEFFVRDANHH